MLYLYEWLIYGRIDEGRQSKINIGLDIASFQDGPSVQPLLILNLGQYAQPVDDLETPKPNHNSLVNLSQLQFRMDLRDFSFLLLVFFLAVLELVGLHVDFLSDSRRFL